MTNSQVFWGDAYHRCSPKLLAMCVRYVHDRELAEDLMHEGFMTAIDKYGTYSGTGSFEGWLRRVVVNTVLIYIRKSKQFNFLKLDDEIEFEYEGDDRKGDDSDDNERQVIEQAGFTQRDLRLLLFEIPDRYRIVFNLYVLEGYQHSEIASLLNIAVGTSKSNLARARKKITELLYQKANEKRKDRKKAAVILISMLFVDGLFKNAFAEQQIFSNGMPEKLQVKIQYRSTKSGGSESAIINKLKLVLFGGVGLFVGSIILLITLKKPEARQSPSFEVATEDSAHAFPSIQTPPQKINTPVPLPKTKRPTSRVVRKSDPLNDTTRAIRKVPVIIKKQVIVRDTVFVQKKNEK